MKLAIIEPFLGGSHEAWVKGVQSVLNSGITRLFSLPDRFWKWRMHGGAITLAKQLNESGFTPDVILASDMLDVALFRSLLLPGLRSLPVIVYFHENQFEYPDNSGMDILHYRFINYTSALAADRILFNSGYNRESFMAGAQKMLRSFPEYRNLQSVEETRKKSEILPLGFDCKEYRTSKNRNPVPVILWNHRMEHDKGPDEFFEALFALDKQQIPFQLAVCGKEYSNTPDIFTRAKALLEHRIIHFGYVKSRTEYLDLLSDCDILPVTSRQDFFGISVVEAVLSGLFPLLPNRLAYPEIFPPDKFENFYYTDLATSLKNSITQYNNGESLLPAEAREHLFQYDWGRMASRYNSLINPAMH